MRLSAAKGHRLDVAIPDGRRGVVRDARPGDAKACIAGVGRVISEPQRTLLVESDELWTPKQWRDRRLEWQSEGAWLVAEVDDAVLGFYVIARSTRRAERHRAEFGIWLVPEGRGLGLGRALLDVGEAWAREHRISRIELTTFAHNERAQRLYRSCGYEIEGTVRRAHRLSDGSEYDGILMAKLL